MSRDNRKKAMRRRADYTGEGHQQVREAISQSPGGHPWIPEASTPAQQLVESAVLHRLVQGARAQWPDGTRPKHPLFVESASPSAEGLKLVVPVGGARGFGAALTGVPANGVRLSSDEITIRRVYGNGLQITATGVETGMIGLCCAWSELHAAIRGDLGPSFSSNEIRLSAGPGLRLVEDERAVLSGLLRRIALFANDPGALDWLFAWHRWLMRGRPGTRPRMPESLGRDLTAEGFSLGPVPCRALGIDGPVDAGTAARLFAHGPGLDGGWHAFEVHSRAVGEMAASFAAEFDASELGRAAGLFHDAGKCACRWQDGLVRAVPRKQAVGVPHKQLGARLLGRRHWIAALAVLSHHDGLTDLTLLGQLLRQPLELDELDTTARFLAAVPEAQQILDHEDMSPTAWKGLTRVLVREIGARMVFSALVDADWLDTATHFRGTPGPRPRADMHALRDRFDERRAKKFSTGSRTWVNQARNEIYTAAVAAASGEPGVYRICGPTGSAKNVAAMGFALHHAAEHGKRRVIVAVPFTTITEQNADDLRDLLDPESGEPVVLEHHSHVEFGADEAGGDEQGQQTDAAQWQRLASENWDAPVVMTTTVQLFDSLFARTPGRMRKLHRLANAVLVLDEVQALPKPLLLPILDVLRTLVEHFRVTVVLTSATQPAFEALSPWHDLDISEIVAKPRELADRMRRVEFTWWTQPRPSLSDVADAVADQRRALVVLNTVRDARAMFRLVSERSDAAVLHLSTRMYPQHRRRTLKKAKQLLDAGDPVVVVSTQLIEAGVNLDFPVVFRAMAPVDSLLQAAGRANREGKTDFGRVVIFDPSDGGWPTDYSEAVGVTRLFFGPGKAFPDDLAALDDYYEYLYSTLNLDAPPAADHRQRPRGQVIQYYRAILDFRSVADGPLVDVATSTARDATRAFRMIDQDGVPVVVAEGEDGERARAWLQKVRFPGPDRLDALRQLQRWTVSLPPHVAAAAVHAGRARRVVGDLHEWLGVYDPWLGIDEASVGEGLVS